MKKFLSFAMVIVLLLSVTPMAYASFGYTKDGDNIGNASKVDFRGTFTSFDGSKITFYGNGYAGGVTTSVSDNTKSTNLTSVELAYGIIRLESPGSLDNTDNRYISLADGTPGQMLTIQLVGNTGGGVITITDDYAADASPITQTGWDDIAFDVALDQVTLLYVDDTVGWFIVSQNGVTVT